MGGGDSNAELLFAFARHWLDVCEKATRKANQANFTNHTLKTKTNNARIFRNVLDLRCISTNFAMPVNDKKYATD